MLCSKWDSYYGYNDDFDYSGVSGGAKYDDDDYIYDDDWYKISVPMGLRNTLISKSMSCPWYELHSSSLFSSNVTCRSFRDATLFKFALYVVCEKS